MLFPLVAASLCLGIGRTPTSVPKPQATQTQASALPMPIDAPREGADTHFYQTVQAVAKALNTKDFDTAKQLAHGLPSGPIVIEYDDRNVPIQERMGFEDQLRGAIQSWQAGTYVGYSFYSTTDPLYARKDQVPNIKIDFQDHLAQDPGTNAPYTVVTFEAEAGKPFETVVGLRRGTHLTKTSPDEILNSIAYGIAKFYGLHDNPIPFSLAYRSSLTNIGRKPGLLMDKSVANHNLDLVKQLKEAITQKRTVNLGAPAISLNPPQIKLDSGVVQGDKISIELQLTNIGSGTLNTIVVPDCSCFQTGSPVRLEAGRTGIYKVLMDTSTYIGQTHKELFLFSSDAEQPEIVIPVDVNIVPRYRFIVPEGDNLLVKPGDKIVEYLFFENSDTKALGWTASPDSVTISQVPWSGTIADTQLGKPPTFKKGIKFILTVPPNFKNKRIPVSLSVSSNDSIFPTITNTVYIQNGIVANPSPAYLGTVQGAGYSFSFDVSRPHKPFRVLGAVNSNPLFKVVTSGSGLGDSHAVKLVLKKQGEPGNFKGRVRVKTNDPKQPFIEIDYAGQFGTP